MKNKFGRVKLQIHAPPCKSYLYKLQEKSAFKSQSVLPCRHHHVVSATVLGIQYIKCISLKKKLTTCNIDVTDWEACAPGSTPDPCGAARFILEREQTLL